MGQIVWSDTSPGVLNANLHPRRIRIACGNRYFAAIGRIVDGVDQEIAEGALQLIVVSQNLELIAIAILQPVGNLQLNLFCLGLLPDFVERFAYDLHQIDITREYLSEALSSFEMSSKSLIRRDCR